jgi:Domain of unknown function (DUF4129)
MPGRPARSGVDAGRAAAVLLLVVLAAVGLRAGGAFSAAGSGTVLSQSGHVLYWALVVGEALLALAGLIYFVARLIWLRGGGAGRKERKRRSIWWILLLPFGVFGLSHVITALRRHGILAHETSGAGGLGAGARGGGAHHAAGSSWQVLVVFAVVVLIAGVVGVSRRRRHTGPPLEELDLAPDSEPLAEALAAGAQALREDPDPRAAIIGCYAAMERSLADAGSPANAADTPAEVLARATEGGLVRSTWASTLTGLFRQARYSSHPMTEADRTTAMGALAQVRADLGSPA